MAYQEIRNEKPELYRAVFEFTQDGNTLGTTDSTENLVIECETQLPGEECFLVMKTPMGWSVDEPLDLANLGIACKGVFDLINDFAAGKVESIHGLPPGVKFVPVSESSEDDTPEVTPEAPITRPASAEDIYSSENSKPDPSVSQYYAPQEVPNRYPLELTEGLEICQWAHDGKYKWTIARFVRTEYGYELHFIGKRPFDSQVNPTDLWDLIKQGQKLADLKFQESISSEDDE